MIEVFLSAEVAIYEYDCTGASRKADALMPGYRAECDKRGRQGPIRRPDRPPVVWAPPSPGTASTLERFDGVDLPLRGAG